MKYHLLGRSGLRVSEICLGTMTFGEEWGWGANKDESRKQFDLFLERGGNFIDTANRYTYGTSEKFLGEFIAGNRERIVLATKYSLVMQKGDPCSSGNSRKNMMQSIDASLKRLNTDYVDLLWLHMWDFLSPVDEVMRAFDDLVRSGKVHYIGISDSPAWVVSQANTMADLRGWTPFVGLQIEYSLMERTPERDLLPMAKALDITITPWAPIAGGALTGKYSRKELAGRTDPRRIAPESKRLSERNMTIAREVDKIADEIGCQSAQVAINWLRQKKQVMIPIIGARSAEQLKVSLDSIEFELTQDQITRLDEISKIELGFPHEFLTTSTVSEILYSGMRSQIHNHRK